MWSALFNTLKSRFAAITSPDAIELRTARQTAYVLERLQNNQLLSTELRCTRVLPVTPDRPVRGYSTSSAVRAVGIDPCCSSV